MRREVLKGRMDVPRFTDPKTAPLVPIQTTISLDREVIDFENEETGVIENKPGKTSVTAVIAGWDRSTDEVIEYRIEIPDIEDAEVTRKTRPLTEDDETWLRNIGARDGIASLS